MGPGRGIPSYGIVGMGYPISFRSLQVVEDIPAQSDKLCARRRTCNFPLFAQSRINQNLVTTVSLGEVSHELVR